MLDLAATREAIAADVRAAFAPLGDDAPTVYAYVPSHPSYPSAMVLEDDTEFIVPGELYGSLDVKWKLLVLELPSPSNEQITRSADAHLSLVLSGLREYAPIVGSYQVATAGGQPYLTIPITLTTHERL